MLQFRLRAFLPFYLKPTILQTILYGGENLSLTLAGKYRLWIQLQMCLTMVYLDESDILDIINRLRLHKTPQRCRSKERCS
jgi:hypothetical protein